MNTLKSQSKMGIVVTAIFFAFLSLSNFAFAQSHKLSCCGDGMDKDVVAMGVSTGDTTKKHDAMKEMHQKMDMKETQKKVETAESIVREGKIALKAIDKNKDGKVFECPMDWNVLSDSAGKCPECHMKLKEMTLKEAKKNLIDNGYKVK